MMILGAGSELKLAAEIIVENREYFTSTEYSEAKTYLTQKKIDMILKYKGTQNLDAPPIVDRRASYYHSNCIKMAKLTKINKNQD